MTAVNHKLAKLSLSRCFQGKNDAFKVHFSVKFNQNVKASKGS